MPQGDSNFEEEIKTVIKLTNPNRTIELSPETGVFRTAKLQPGETGNARGEGKDRWAYATGIRSKLITFEVGATVIVPADTEDYYTDWECFTVAENPHFTTPEEAENIIKEVSFDEFNVRRHGEVG